MPLLIVRVKKNEKKWHKVIVHDKLFLDIRVLL